MEKCVKLGGGKISNHNMKKFSANEWGITEAGKFLFVCSVIGSVRVRKVRSHTRRPAISVNEY